MFAFLVIHAVTLSCLSLDFKDEKFRFIYFSYIEEMNEYMHVTTLGTCSSLGRDDRAFK